MCLLLTLMAAVAATVAWYACEKRGTYRLGTLCLIYWGAGLMSAELQRDTERQSAGSLCRNLGRHRLAGDLAGQGS